MTRFIPVLLIAFFLLPVSAQAGSEFKCKDSSDCLMKEVCNEESKCVFPTADWRKGLEIEARGGLSNAVANRRLGDEQWGESELGGGGGLFAGIRPVSTFSAGIDVGYFMLGYKSSPNSNGFEPSLSRFLNVMAEMRKYVPYGFKRSGFGDVFFKVGLGYLSLKQKEGSDMSQRLHNPLNFKLGIGATFYFSQQRKTGDIGLGMGIDYLVFFAKRYKFCGEMSETDECREGKYDDFETPFHPLQITLHLKWLFPLFQGTD